jgi:hypothetical protein
MEAAALQISAKSAAFSAHGNNPPRHRWYLADNCLGDVEDILCAHLSGNTHHRPGGCQKDKSHCETVHSLPRKRNDRDPHQ